MQKATVASLLAIALFIVIAPSMASSADWQTVDNWTNISGQKVWHTVDTWNDNFQMKYWQTVDSWGNVTQAVYIVGALTLISPENNENIYDTTPTFYWIPGENANSHRFLLDNDDDFSSPEENVLLGPSAAAYAIIIPLDNDNYWWKVIASSAWMENSSEVRTFELIKPTVDTFGYETKGGTNSLDGISARIAGSRFTCVYAGIADNITVYLLQWGGALPKIKCALYKASDNSLVGYTEEWTITLFWDGWKTFDIISGGNLEAGTDYYIVAWAETYGEFVHTWYDTDTDKGAYQSLAYGSWPDPADFTSEDRKYSIYCSYTLVPPYKQWQTVDQWDNPLVIEYEYPGSGTVDDPYIVENIWALQGMTDFTAHYALDNDIDATATQTWNENSENAGQYFGFDPLGTIANKFTGSFDGRGHTIDNLYINRLQSYHVGLFGYVGAAGIIENIGLENENVISKYVTGGLVGRNEGIVSNSYTTGSVSGIPTLSGYIGGLVGMNDGTVSKSYSTCTVSGGQVIGGFVGYNSGGTISNCYAVGPVSGDDYVGGLIGVNTGTASNSFWDNVTSGQSTSAGGTGKTTENMKDNRTFTDVAWSVGLDAPWDFIGNPYDDVVDADVWDIDEAINNGYPYLTVFVPRWQDADIWSNALVTEEPPEPPPEPPADEFVWIMFIVRFLGLVIPLGIVAWKFSNIDSPRDGAETAVWAMLGFIAIVALWFIADAVEVVLYAL